MGCRRKSASVLGLLASVLWMSVTTAAAQETAVERATSAVPLEAIPAPLRDRMRLPLEKPTFFTRGPSEAFNCCPAQYYWFLEHPDRAVLVWRRLGARCVDIADRGNGRFGWSDTRGSDVSWVTAYRDAHMHVWYAEGNVKPGTLLPLVPVRAVVVLRYAELSDALGQSVIRHQAELYLYTDSRTAALLAKVVGASAPRLGEQYVAQLEMFYSALTWYLNEHPRQAGTLLSETAESPPTQPAYVPALSTSPQYAPRRFANE